MTLHRRASDHFTRFSLTQAVVGLAIIAGGVGLKLHGGSEQEVDILFIIGGLTIPGNHLIDAFKAWRGK